MDYLEKRKYPSADYNATPSHYHNNFQQSDYQQHKRIASASGDSGAPSDQAGLINATMDCPGQKVGFVIGRKGTAIAAITERSGCRISIDSNQHQDPRKIYLQGAPGEVTMAMQLISRVLAEGPNAILPEEDPKALGTDGIVSEKYADLMCPFEKVSILIGYRGQTVLEIGKRTGCRVTVVQDGVPDGIDREIMFKGTPHQIEDAKVLVRSVLLEGPNSALGIGPPGSGNPNNPSTPSIAFDGGENKQATHLRPGERVQERDIDPSKVGMVIGPKGAVLADVMKGSSGCKIFINQKFPEGEPHKIVYTGTDAQINAAVEIVEGILNGTPYRFMNQVANSSRGGSGQTYGQPFAPSGGGHFGNVPMSLPMVPTSNLPSNAPTSSQEITLYQSQVQRIIGPNGSFLQDMQMRYRIQINFELLTNVLGLPGDPVNRVTLRGHPADTQAAVKMIYHMIGISDPNGNSNLGVDMSSASTASMSNNSSSNIHQSSTASNSLALGADGSAGLLEPSMTLPDGLCFQVAELRNEIVGKVIGKQSSTLNLIKSKSGAQLHVNASYDRQRNTNGSSSISIFGSASSVQTATQMIQEVLISGLGKLYAMPEVSMTVAANYQPNFHGHGYSHGHGHSLSMGGSTTGYASNSFSGSFAGAGGRRK